MPTPEPPAEDERRRTVVLVIDDDAQFAALVRATLEPGAYDVHHEATAGGARSAVERTAPDLIILDLALPDADGLVLLGNLRAWAHAPVIVCSARPREPNAVLSLRLGAADFIPKPLAIGEFEARVEAVLRRSSGRAEGAGPPAARRIGVLEMDQQQRVMTVTGVPLRLTPTEYRLLDLLALHFGQTVPREALAREVWGSYDAAINRAIDVHVVRLRAKLAAASDRAPAVVAVRGFGFTLVLPAPTDGDPPDPPDAARP